MSRHRVAYQRVAARVLLEAFAIEFDGGPGGKSLAGAADRQAPFVAQRAAEPVAPVNVQAGDQIFQSLPRTVTAPLRGSRRIGKVNARPLVNPFQRAQNVANRVG